ncbi:hypothetical protein [Paenibacillus hamazuiensis]|uniref:hypothetical protein n=1 Tax=Paenibacillus hamazuiensis TaxID=2936508 RepID=UPI00200EC530|nr:hypothetical protein [Paenibacillus hamazuiensis]
MKISIFAEAAEYARIHTPYEKNVLIAPIETWPEIGFSHPSFPRYPVLFVTRTGYIPYATKTEILRRGNANLFLLGGEAQISEWVAYALSALTKGFVFRRL